MTELDKICTLLDKLTLDTLTLMEQHIQHKLSLEEAMKDGEINLVKSRYILGQSSVSKLQIPAQDGNEFKAGTVVNSEEHEDLGCKMFDIEFIDKDKSEEKVLDPLKWFGVLVPQNLHLAQKKYKEALIWVGEVANIQSRLDNNCKKISQLKKMKFNIQNGNNLDE